jgi:CelD/BcsL family acetyltransferase involved in cellulose biosynthesis
MKAPAPSLLVLDQLDGWASQWDQLVDRSPLPSPFLRSWWLTGAGGPRPRFLLVIREDQLVGGLALEEGHRLGLPCLQMMSAGPLCPDHLDLLATPGEEHAVLDLVESWLRRPGSRIFDLQGILGNPRLIKAFPSDVRCEPVAVAPWAPLPGDFEAYLAARPALFRRNFRRAAGRLARAGATHRRKTGWEAVRSLDTLRQLHSAQWGNRSHFLGRFERFAAACRLAADLDEVSVHEFVVEQIVIAIVVTFEVAGRVSLYQSARVTDSRWRDAQIVLLTTIISDACHRGFTEVDFLRGDEGYKRNFAQEQRQILRLEEASGTAGRTGLMAYTAARKYKHMADRSFLGKWSGARLTPKDREVRPGRAQRTTQEARRGQSARL